MSRRRPLSYSEYVNDVAIVEALRLPQTPPAGQDIETWPTWYAPGTERPHAKAVEWSPGEAWPRQPGWSHHEVIFIRAHQAFEVWFALVIHEIDAVLRQAHDLAKTTETSLRIVELSERGGDASQFDAARFPRLAEVIGKAKNEALRARLRLFPTPGHYRCERGIGPVEVASLQTWTEHIERATKALSATLPFFDVLHTLTPQQFLEFRGRLAPASGFGSAQFRALEILIGLRELARGRLQPECGLDHDDEGPLPQGVLCPGPDTPAEQAGISYSLHMKRDALAALARRFRAPTLRDLVYSLLNSNVFMWDQERVRDTEYDHFAAINIREVIARYDADGAYYDEAAVGEHLDALGDVLAHHEVIIAAMLASRQLKGKPRQLRSFLDAVMDLDAAVLKWRDRHIRFVEQIIGRRPGTGGAGVHYLRGTTNSQLAWYITHGVPCLWQARTLVQRL